MQSKNSTYQLSRLYIEPPKTLAVNKYTLSGQQDITPEDTQGQRHFQSQVLSNNQSEIHKTLRHTQEFNLLTPSVPHPFNQDL